MVEIYISHLSWYSENSPKLSEKLADTSQKIEFPFKDFFSKCKQLSNKKSNGNHSSPLPISVPLSLSFKVLGK